MKFEHTDFLEGMIEDYVELTSKKYTVTKSHKTNKIIIPIEGTLTFDFASGTRTFDVTTYNNTKSNKKTKQ